MIVKKVKNKYEFLITILKIYKLLYEESFNLTDNQIELFAFVIINEDKDPFNNHRILTNEFGIGVHEINRIKKILIDKGCIDIQVNKRDNRKYLFTVADKFKSYQEFNKNTFSTTIKIEIEDEKRRSFKEGLEKYTFNSLNDIYLQLSLDYGVSIEDVKEKISKFENKVKWFLENPIFCVKGIYIRSVLKITLINSKKELELVGLQKLIEEKTKKNHDEEVLQLNYIINKWKEESYQ